MPVLAKKCPDSKQREISYANARLGPLVLEENLNRSESSWALASPPALPQNDSTHDAPGGHCTAGFQSGPCPLWVKSGAANRAERSGYVRFAFQS